MLIGKKVETIYLQRLIIRMGLFFLIIISSQTVFSQTTKGKVLSIETNLGIGYVNIGVMGEDVGTVCDGAGNYSITLDNRYNNDSIRFSMIGYEPKTFLVSQFKKNAELNILLQPKDYNLPEITVVYHRPKEIKLGTEVLSNELRSGFEYNDLGSELGVEIKVRKRVRLMNINFNVAVCTFDSVTYRLNIYKAVNDTNYVNILNEQLYITFTKDKITKVITFDLSKYNIVIDGDALLALELYRDLGEGRLLFHTQFFTGTTFHRKSIEGRWVESPGAIGMYAKGHVLK